MLHPFLQGRGILIFRGVAQLVAREVWDFDAVGSNPATPTKKRGFDRKIKAVRSILAAFYHHLLGVYHGKNHVF